MHFSLILATIGRTEELKRFLASLDKQTLRRFELIMADQNPDDRIKPLLEPYQDHFPIMHLHRPTERGASKARNVGLQHANGDVLTFPDDDCWYLPQLLEKIA